MGMELQQQLVPRSTSLKADCPACLIREYPIGPPPPPLFHRPGWLQTTLTSVSLPTSLLLTVPGQACLIISQTVVITVVTCSICQVLQRHHFKPSQQPCEVGIHFYLGHRFVEVGIYSMLNNQKEEDLVLKFKSDSKSLLAFVVGNILSLELEIKIIANVC